MKFKLAVKYSLVLLLMSLIAPSYAYAYIDPGTGAYVFQILTAMIVGGLFAVKQFWGKITSFFKKQ